MYEDFQGEDDLFLRLEKSVGFSLEKFSITCELTKLKVLFLILYLILENKKYLHDLQRIAKTG